MSKKEDPRINLILELLLEFARGNLDARASHSGIGDALDAIIETSNMLAEELKASMISKTFLESILSSMADMLVVANSDGTIVIVNETTCRTLDYSQRDLIGQQVDIIFDQPLEELSLPGLSHQYSTPQDALRDLEVYLKTKNGALIPSIINCSVTPSIEGNPQAIVIAARDITMQKQAEEALREADRRKDQFLAVLSHELRNPLAPIQNSLFILDCVSPEGDQAMHAKAIIKRQIGHLTRLVNDLLDINRLTRGKLRLQNTRFELVHALGKIAQDYQAEFLSAGIEFELQVPDKQLWMISDPMRLAQVVGNLLQNAIKFTGKGGQVVLALHEEPIDQMAVIYVRDTGVGISHEILPRLFEPFMQADKTLDRSLGGLGLGLALVKELIELLGGEVSAHSNGINTGAEFIIRLPLEAKLEIIPANSSRKRNNSSERVLVIEDNIDAAESLRVALNLFGHQVAVTYNGVDALQKGSEFKPTIVLCDIGLPGMSGYDVARAFRADKTLCNVALVALTGYALPEDKFRATEAGFDLHLAKPLSLQDIQKVITSLKS